VKGVQVTPPARTNAARRALLITVLIVLAIVALIVFIARRG
jgi:Tfp pilus assembly protein PilX